MNEDLTKLEREVEAALASLSADLSAEPAEALVSRVKASVRHALNEAWLVGQPTPSPSAEALQRVRTAVHEEWQRSGEPVTGETDVVGGPTRRWTWSRVGPALAAAAMIGIGVGIIHYAGTLKPPALPADPATEARVDLFVEAAEEVLAQDPSTALILTDLDELEEGIGQGEPVWEYETGVLSDIVEEIDEWLAEPESGKSTSGVSTVTPGAFA